MEFRKVRRMESTTLSARKIRTGKNKSIIDLGGACLLTTQPVIIRQRVYTRLYGRAHISYAAGKLVAPSRWIMSRVIALIYYRARRRCR